MQECFVPVTAFEYIRQFPAVATQMYDTVADTGLLPCIPLAVDDDIVCGDESGRGEPLCWRGGIQFVQSRVTILKVARIQNISLVSLSRLLDIKWEHFLEWADDAGEDVCLIFTNHRWHDEITSTEQQFVQLRRDQLAVGDYFEVVPTADSTGSE